MIEFFIQSAMMADGVHLYAKEKNEYNGKSYALELDQTTDGILSVKRVELTEQGSYKPLLVLTSELAAELLPAIQKALDQAKVPKPSESRLEGRLEATERHLDDMRKLVFGGDHDDTRV